MKTLILASVIAAVAVPAAPALAQDRADREYRRDVREAQREYRRDMRDARRDWRQYRRYDWNRPEPGRRGYDPARYYRDGRYYQSRRLSRRDRIYRGYDGRYYCRRTDGTTGLILGGAIGGLLGNSLATGRSSTFETILGAGAGALLGREIDRGRVTCR